MCNSSCILWVFKNISSPEIEGKRILEVGSFDVNGSPRLVINRLKPLAYVGVDISEGKGVDTICKCEELVDRFGKETFDFVISTCTLEHVLDWKISVSNIKQVCKVGGHIIIIVPSKWPQHDFPHDYWRFSKDNLVRIFSDFRIIKLDSDFNTGRDVNDKLVPLSLIYIKCQKPEGFKEIDLENYAVENIQEDSS